MTSSLRRANRRHIRRRGREVTFIRKPTTARDADRPWEGKVAVSDGDNTTLTVRFRDFKKSEVDGERIRATDQHCKIVPADLSNVKPTTEDRILDSDGTEYAIMAVSEFRPGTTAFRYMLQLRA